MSGIRRLDDRERVEWPAYARSVADHFTGANRKQILKAMEQAKCEVEKAEIVCLVLERRLRQLGDEDFHNPLPSRKAVEAVELAFRDFKAKTARFGV